MAEKTLPDPDAMNDRRAADVQEALVDFWHKNNFCKTDLIDPVETASDFLCNFAHYCDQNGLDYKKLLATAAMHYEEETDGKGEQFAFLAPPHIGDHPGPQ